MAEKGIFIEAIPLKGGALLAGSGGVQKGQVGRMWGRIELVQEADLDSAPVNERTIQKTESFTVQGAGRMYVRLHPPMACALSFINAPNHGEKPNCKVYGVDEMKWSAALAPLTADIRPVHGSSLTREDILDMHATNFVHAISVFDVEVTEFILPGHELLLDYQPLVRSGPHQFGDLSKHRVLDLVQKTGLRLDRDSFNVYLSLHENLHRFQDPRRRSGDETESSDEISSGQSTSPL